MILSKNRKGVSIIIGYVLLVTFAIIIGGVIYQWLKTYVPTDFLECPDGVSTFIVEVSCTNIADGSELDLTIKNNGRFDIAGYFIHATNDSGQELATIDLSKYHVEGGNKLGSAIVFTLGKENSIKPNDEKRSIFEYTSEIYLIEITPIRFQVEDNKQRLASCGNAKIKEQIVCGTWCIPDCDGKICGDDGCGGKCPPDDCDAGYFCNATGNCEEIPATCEDGIDPPCDAGECDSCPQDCSHTDCCGDGTCNNNETCGDTDNEPECNSDCGACDIVCGDGIVESPEQCDTGNLSGGTCESVMGAGWTGDLSCYSAGHAQECNFDTTGCYEVETLQESIVFVSSTSFNGNLGGISGADAECNSLAGAADLSGTFVAWLSNSTTDAKDRIPQDIPFNRTDGATVADNLADLLDGSIDIKISVDEQGATEVKDSVWTGTNETGYAVVGDNCNDWQSSASGDGGTRGKTDKIDLGWTKEAEEIACNEIYRIYCFQVS